MVTKADIAVEITMSLDQALALQKTLADLSVDHPTDPIYQALAAALDNAQAALEDR